MMGDWPQPQMKAAGLSLVLWNQETRESKQSPQNGSQGLLLPNISTMLTWLRQLGSCTLAVCKSVSVYKIKHICGSTQKSDESECTLTGSAVSVHVAWRESSFTSAGLLGKPTSWIRFLYSCLFVFGFQWSPLAFTFTINHVFSHGSQYLFNNASIAGTLDAVTCVLYLCTLRWKTRLAFLSQQL